MGKRRRGNGQGSIYEANGILRGSCRIPGTDKRKYFSGKTRREVEEKIRDFLHEQKHGTPVTSGNESLEHYLIRWMEDVVAAREVRPTTHASYDHALRTIRAAPIDTTTLGAVPLKDLHPAHIQRAYKVLLQHFTSSSLRKMHAVLHDALHTAVGWDLILRNPAEYVDLPKMHKVIRPELTREQIHQFMEATREDRLHALWVVYMYTGIRRGEGLGLTWTRVHDGHIAIDSGKTHNAIRDVPLLEQPRIALKQHRQRQLEERMLYRDVWEDHGLVFCREDGTPITNNFIWKAWKEALKHACLPDMRIHDCRHSFVHHLQNAEVDIDVAQVMVGHASVSTTIDIYGRVSGTRVEAAAAKLQAYMDTA